MAIVILTLEQDFKYNKSCMRS